MTPREIIERLKMEPHPEGGWYAETWRERPAGAEPRAAGSCIYFLLERGQRSHWHRVDATEIWHFHSGAGLTLRLSATDEKRATEHRLGPDLAAGERPQLIVPAHHWQAAEAREGWCLVSCTVSPGFEFSGFEMASPGWEPGAS